MILHAARFFTRWLSALTLAAVVFTAAAHLLGTTASVVITADTQQILRVSHLFHFPREF